MLKAVNIEDAIAPLPVLRNRRPETQSQESGSAFATLAKTATGGVFAGSFDGESEWERHCNGDELVHVLKGEAHLTILLDGERKILDMGAGTIAIVPSGYWHKFHAPNGVTLLTMTPQPTDHSTAKNPLEPES